MKEKVVINNVDVAIDLGSSALKIAFSYMDNTPKKKLHFGKITDNTDSSEIGIPAIAFYDEKASKWVFGSQISGALARDFSIAITSPTLSVNFSTGISTLTSKVSLFFTRSTTIW